MKTVGQAVAAHLREQGIEYAFGVPGGEVTDLIEALRATGIHFLLTRHETTAAFMADTYGALTGKPGVCIATLGPGATNMLTGVANAYLDRSPVLALTGDLADDRYDHVPHQRLDLSSLYRPVTKWAAKLAAAGTVDSIEQAIAVATAERPGPVHIAVPSNLSRRTLHHGGTRPDAPPPATVPVTAPGMATATIGRVAERLEEAHTPVILAGLSVVRSEATQAIRELARKLHIPVVVTPKAKGVMPEDDVLAAGVAEVYGDRLVFDLLKRADLLLAIGLDAVELDKLWILDTPTISIDSVPDHDGFYPIDLELVGDLRDIVEQIVVRVGAHHKWQIGDLTRHRRELRHVLTPVGAALATHEVVDAVRSALPRETIATCDTGAHKMLVSQLWAAYEPKTYFVSNGLSSMGYSLAAAMTVALLEPERPVVAFIGDGGMGMCLGELDTCRRLRLPVIVVVLNDQSLWSIRASQERKGYPPTGVDFSGTELNFARVAEALGADGAVVESAEACVAAVRRAAATRTFTVIDARIDGRAYRPEMAESGAIRR